MRSNNYSYEVALGNVPRASLINKFGYNADIDSAAEEIVASFGGEFDPTVNIITTAQTLTITYNSTTDGLGTTGALSLIITYLDENFTEVSAFHTLGSDGSDVTSFTCLGVNRCIVYSNGGTGTNTNNITLTATTDTTIQAMIPAESSVTQQCIFHIPIGKTVLLDFIFINVLKLSGGSSPRVNVRAFSWSRVTETAYRLFDLDIDTSVENTVQLNLKQPFPLTGREVFYIVASTNTNDTKVNARFSGVSQDS